METKITFQHPPKPVNPPETPEMRGVDIHFISAQALNKLCQDLENITFRISMNELPNKDTTEPSSIPVQRVDGSPIENIEPILEEYRDFEDVFSGGKANTLAPHHPYNLQIELKTGAKPTYGLIYSLSPPELAALQDFIEENT